MYSLQMLTKLYVSSSETIRSHRRRDCSSPVIAKYGGASPISDRRWRLDGKRISMLRFSVDLISGGARSGSNRAEAAGAAGKPVGDRQQQMAADLDGGIVKDPRITKIASSIRVIPNFPKSGIIFQDITTLLLDHAAFKHTIDMFVERYQGKGISVVAGVEARGFIFGPPIALAIGAKFVPLRKPGKLPGKVISEEYSLEYGTDKLEMHIGAVEAGEKALIIDDLIATGGTLGAAIKLLERVGVEVVECACVIEIPELNGRDRLGDKPLFVLVSTV